MRQTHLAMHVARAFEALDKQPEYAVLSLDDKMLLVKAMGALLDTQVSVAANLKAMSLILENMSKR